MADSAVSITAGSGTAIDTRTEATNGNHRQVMVIGDPATNAGVAPVDATNGLSVSLTTALPAGTAAIGKLAANSGVDIGDVDVTTLPAITGSVTANAGTNLNTSALALESGGNLATAATKLTGLSKAEDAAHSSGDQGVMPLAVRRDANTSLVTTDGDYAPVQVDANGSLKVAITSGAGSGGTSIADEAAFTVGSTSLTPVGGIYESSPTALTTGQAGILALDSSRNVLTHEQYAPTAEDNNNQVIAQQIRPVAASTYSASRFGIFGTDVDLAAKASAGNLFSIIATNTNAAVRWLQIHNKATAPASTNVPVLSLPIPAGTANNPGYLRLNRSDFGEGGMYLSTGVAIGISTAEATFTAATTTDHDYYGEYI